MIPFRKTIERTKGTEHEGVRVDTDTLIGLRESARHLPLKAGSIWASMSGAYSSPFRGRGMEFEEVRPYQEGDDIRSLDWRVTARTTKPYTKLFREERERPVLLWVDYRRPMFFATKGCFKAVMAAKAAALLAWSAVHQGDRLGGLVFSETDRLELRPSQGKSSAVKFINHLTSHPAWDSYDNSEDISADTTWSLDRLRRVARPGSLIFLISDFRGLDAKAEANLKYISAHSDLVFLFLQDPLERELPPSGNYNLTNGHDILSIETTSASIRHNYANRFKAHRERLIKLCHGQGNFLIDCCTSQDIFTTLKNSLRRPLK